MGCSVGFCPTYPLIYIFFLLRIGLCRGANWVGVVRRGEEGEGSSVVTRRPKLSVLAMHEGSNGWDVRFGQTTVRNGTNGKVVGHGWFGKGHGKWAWGRAQGLPRPKTPYTPPARANPLARPAARPRAVRAATRQCRFFVQRICSPGSLFA